MYHSSQLIILYNTLPKFSELLVHGFLLFSISVFKFWIFDPISTNISCLVMLNLNWIVY
jgi:hypothetical protein